MNFVLSMYLHRVSEKYFVDIYRKTYGIKSVLRMSYLKGKLKILVLIKEYFVIISGGQAQKENSLGVNNPTR